MPISKKTNNIRQNKIFVQSRVGQKIKTQFLEFLFFTNN